MKNYLYLLINTHNSIIVFLKQVVGMEGFYGIVFMVAVCFAI